MYAYKGQRTLSGVTMPARRSLSAASCDDSASLTRSSVSASNRAVFACRSKSFKTGEIISLNVRISGRAAALSPRFCDSNRFT